MAKKYILALDQGTTSSRAIIFNKKGEIVAKAQNEFTQHYPENGWVEHDPMEILFSQISAILTVLRKEAVDPKEIAAIGITNQREPGPRSRESSCPWCGKRRPVVPFITPSCGSVAARRTCARN